MRTCLLLRMPVMACCARQWECYLHVLQWSHSRGLQLSPELWPSGYEGGIWVMPAQDEL